MPMTVSQDLWDRYFMGIALLSAKRSKDKKTQVGACVVNEEYCVVGTGYNGMPLNCDDNLIWGPDGECPQDSTEVTVEKEKHNYVCHAEMNAIVNRNPKSVKDCTLYVTLFPCNECAKIIIKSGIKRLLYLSDEKAARKAFQDSRKMLEKQKKIDKIVDYSKLAEKSNENHGKVENMTETICFNLSGADTKLPPISWDQYFMALAIWSGQVLGEDEHTPKRGACVLYGDEEMNKGKVGATADTTQKEGACVVNKDKRIVGLGFVQNMAPDDEDVKNKNHCVMHAPVNAIVNQSPASLKGCTLYAVRYPCCECAKVVVQSGIVKLVYLKDEIRQLETWENVDKDIRKKKLAAEKMFSIAHIKTEAYNHDDRRMQPLSLSFGPKPTKRERSLSTEEESKRPRE